MKKIVILLLLSTSAFMNAKPEMDGKIVCFPTVDDKNRKENDFKITGYKTTDRLDVTKTPFLKKNDPGVCVAYAGFDGNVDKKLITTFLFTTLYKAGVVAPAAAAPVAKTAGTAQIAPKMTDPKVMVEIVIVVLDKAPTDVDSILKGGQLAPQPMDLPADASGKANPKKGYCIYTKDVPQPNMNAAIEQLGLLIDPPAILASGLALLKK